MDQIQILEYVTARGRNHYRTWLASLDRPVRERMEARVRRMASGNFGQDRHLGGGMHEAKFDMGPGYRLYYGNHGGCLVLLLCGGDKSGQAKDIALARTLWRDYLKGRTG